MFSKIDVSSLIFAHLRALRDIPSPHTSRRDLALFYGVPSLLTPLWALTPAPLDRLVPVLACAFPVAGLGGVVIALALMGLPPVSKGRGRRGEEQLLRAETVANALYGAVVAWAGVLALAMYCASEAGGLGSQVGAGLAGFALLHLAWMVLMVLKRVHVLASRRVLEETRGGEGL